MRCCALSKAKGMIIKMNGLIPNKDINIDIIGLRPGEKIYEELVGKLERSFITDKPQIKGIFSSPLSQSFNNSVHKLVKRAQFVDRIGINCLLKEVISEFEYDKEALVK